MGTNLIKEGTLVLLRPHRFQNSETFGIVLRADYEKDRFELKIVTPNASGQTFNFSGHSLRHIAQMEVSDIDKPDILNRVIVALGQEAIRLAKIACEQAKVIDSQKRQIGYYRCANKQLAQ